MCILGLNAVPCHATAGCRRLRTPTYEKRGGEGGRGRIGREEEGEETDQPGLLQQFVDGLRIVGFVCKFGHSITSLLPLREAVRTSIIGHGPNLAQNSESVGRLL